MGNYNSINQSINHLFKPEHKIKISVVNSRCMRLFCVMMFTTANQSQRTVSRLLANKKRTSSQTANIVGQHKMLANFLNTRQTLSCLSCVRGFTFLPFSSSVSSFSSFPFRYNQQGGLGSAVKCELHSIRGVRGQNEFGVFSPVKEQIYRHKFLRFWETEFEGKVHFGKQKSA